VGERQLSTAWLLAGEFGLTMTPDQFRARFMPDTSEKTYRNRLSAGALPPLTNGVFDVQDVAEWWDGLRKLRR
jgi:hypothetical protein